MTASGGQERDRRRLGGSPERLSATNKNIGVHFCHAERSEESQGFGSDETLRHTQGDKKEASLKVLSRRLLHRGLLRQFRLTARLLIVRVLNFDTPTPWPFVRWHRHDDFEYAILECRFCILRVDPFGQRDAAIKFAVASFAPLIAFVGFFMLPAPLALNRQRVIREFDLDIFFLETRQIS